jgi:hypothetical protein
VVTRLPSELGSLAVVFERQGEAPERQIVLGLAADPARAGERALIYGLQILLRRGRLQAGDRLTVTAAE